MISFSSSRSCLWNSFHLAAVSMVICICKGNRYDPHLFPRTGPFFEGWYMRIVDFDTLNSIGLLFGHVLPQDSATTNQNPLVFSSILVRKCYNISTTCVLKSYDAAFSLSDLTITVNGKPVTHDPNDTSPSNFKWEMTSKFSQGIFINTETSTKFSFQFGNISLEGELGQPVPWGPDGVGPEGWIDNLPFLPLHWFVYSLHSPIRYYEVHDKTTGEFTRGVNGAAHLEKNWGVSFPKGWIWSQGVSPYGNITFAISGGPVDIRLVSVKAFLFGYRNPAKSINLNFRPDDSIITVNHAGCLGFINVTASGLLHEVHMLVTAMTSSFSDCLYGPEIDGFKKVCKESYDAKSEIIVFERSVFGTQIIDKQIVYNSALEFGGSYMCQKCQT